MDARLAETLFWLSLVVVVVAASTGIWWLLFVGIAIQALLLFIGTR